MPLTDTVCKTAKADERSRKLFDGGGLYLEVLANGRKYWRLKYRHGGKEKRLALGVYPEVSLKKARDKRAEARALISEGLDPSHVKKKEKLKHYMSQDHSFETIAREWHDLQKSTWTVRHAMYVIKRLEADIFPTIGSFPVANITAPELLSTLRKVEKRGATDIARRLLQTCGQIFRYSIATGRGERDITADLRGALKPHKATHFTCLGEKDLPEFLLRLEQYDGDMQTKLAMKLLLLTFVRTGELRGARWEEVDRHKGEWRIPAQRMKMREEHIVPLSKQALGIIDAIHLISGQKTHLFPNRNRPTEGISENTLLYALYRMGYHSRATIHGFRSMASTVLNEHGFRGDVIERQLAHGERNKVRASYNHAQYLPERREMMQWWGDYLEKMGMKEIT